MKNLIKKVLVLSLFLGLSLNASTMFLLTKIDKAYLVVENYSKSLTNANLKKEVMNSLKETADELEIDTKDYSYRTLAFILYDTYIGDTKVLNVDLILGEEVKRLDDSKEVYALTYKKSKQFIVKDIEKDELEEEIIDSVDSLLSSFSEQYIEDNE